LPLRFGPVADATNGDADFVARGPQYLVSLSGGNAHVVIGARSSDVERATLTMRLVGNSSRVDGVGRHLLPGITNVLIGNDPRKWQTGIRSYGEVEYDEVYRGVDLVYYGNQRQLEYDFVVRPGADYRAIRVAFDGASAVSIDPKGNLIIGTGAGSLVQRTPVIYQERAGRREPVRGGYTLRGGNEVSFWVGVHDPHRPLIIDPWLTYSSYLGGSLEDRAAGVGVDAQGNIYVAGLTGAANFPVAGPSESAHGRNNWDAFVIKLNAAGDQLLYATYLGGSGYDEPFGFAVDSAGGAYVTGTTSSWDFPMVNAIQPTRRGQSDSFVTKLNANGSIAYSTYLGGNQDEYGQGVAVDGLGRAYVSGQTLSSDFPTANAHQSFLGGSPLFKTTDDGVQWLGIGPHVNMVRAFAVDPVNPSTVYAGTSADGVFRSVDSGATWTATSADLPPVPVNAMAVDASGALYVGNDFSLYRSRDQGASWTDVQLWTTVSSLAVDPGTGTLYAASPDGSIHSGVLMSTDGGDTWTNTGLPMGATSLAVSQSVVYAGTQIDVFKRTGTDPWLPANTGFSVPITSLAADPGNPDHVYAGSFFGLFVTTSGGSSWTPLPFGWTLNICIAPSNPSIVYVALGAGAVMTRDAGMTWQPAGPPGAYPMSFAIDPVAPTTVYAASSVGYDAFLTRISADGSTIEYSTYLGGSSSEWNNDVAVDASGNAYVTGVTQSTDFPVLNPYQANARGVMEVFVAKFSESGTLSYSTYLGGTASDYNPRIAVDAIGQAHVVGLTLSPNFPTVNAFQPAHGGGFTDVFVTTLNAAGNALVFSTYLGGSDQEVDSTQNMGPAVAVGTLGETFVTGTTRSANFPMRDPIQPAYAGGGTDAFVATFDAAGHLSQSTYLGGTGDDYGRRVAVAPNGAIVVAGATFSNDFPLWSPWQSANAGAGDVFIARISDQAPDATAPTTTISTAGTAGSNGWYRSDVTVALQAVDNAGGSGVALIEYSLNGGGFQPYEAPFTVGAQGTSIIRGRATDVARNTETPGASASILIDSIPPAVSLVSPTSTDYLHSDALQISFSASDVTSGLSSTVATLDGTPVANGQTIQLLTVPLGSHTLSVSSTDLAGNTAAQSATFRVKATIDSLIAAVNTFAGQGQIGSQTAHSLVSKLADAKQALDRGNLTAARNKLVEFRAQVSSQIGKAIAQAAASVLLTDTDDVMSRM
jgi:hypothetical protein